MKDTQLYAGAVLLGAMAGLRTMSAPAIITHLVPAEALLVPAPALRLLAVGEAVADKLPFMPSRTAIVPLIGRGLSGGISGAAVFSSRKRSPWIGGLLGAAAAIGATFAAYNIRKNLTTSRRLPDTAVALAEDAVVAGAGWLVAKGLGNGAALTAV